MVAKRIASEEEVNALLLEVAVEFGASDKTLILADEFLLEALSDLKEVAHLRHFVIGFEHPAFDEVDLVEKLAYLAMLSREEVVQALVKALGR